MSLGEDVILEFAVPCTITRTRAPAVVDGRRRDLGTEEVVIRACIQPASGRDLRLLPEEMRTSESVAVFTPDVVLGLDDATGRLADVVHHKGERYQVHTIFDWSDAGGFYKAIAIKVPR